MPRAALQSAPAKAPAKPLIFTDAFNLAMKEFGFIVIGYKNADYCIGDRLSDVWGNGLPPVRCHVTGKSTRDEWIRQNRFLIAHGADFTTHPGALKPPKGMKYLRCGGGAPTD